MKKAHNSKEKKIAMEMQSPEDEGEFIVIKAGPPLPIRRPRKSHPTTFEPHRNPPTPLAPVVKGSGSRIPRPPSPFLTPVALSNKSDKNTETEITKSTLNNSTPRGSQEQQQHHPLVILKHRPPTPTLQVESKVRQYIQKVKKSDEFNRLHRVKAEKVLSLEELYQVSPPMEKNEEIIQDKLRQTLRILKEKDEMINKLRESCHDLKLKWADAENRVDEMRFGIGGNGRSSQGQRSLERGKGHGFIGLNKRSVSEINLSSSNSNEKKAVMKDQETETELILDKIRDNKSRKTLTTEDDLNEFDLDDRQSDFDPVLEEKCTNWLEKVQNWQLDSNHNLSQDSCGDRDSGFRGSAELEPRPPPPSSSRRLRSSRTTRSKTKSRTKDSKKSPEEEEGQRSTRSPTPLDEQETHRNIHEQQEQTHRYGKTHVSSSTSRTLKVSSLPTSFQISPGDENEDSADPSSLQIADEKTHRHQKTYWDEEEVTYGNQEEEAQTHRNRNTYLEEEAQTHRNQRTYLDEKEETRRIRKTRAPSSQRKNHNLSSSTLRPLKRSSLPTNFQITYPVGSSSVITMTTKCDNEHEEDSTGPSSLHIAQPWHTFASNVNPQSTTEYQGFPSFHSSTELSNSHKFKSMSTSLLDYSTRRCRHYDPNCDEHLYDHRQVLRSIDKGFKTLHPLLDDATKMALRVKMKSERLAKILQDKNNQK